MRRSLRSARWVALAAAVASAAVATLLATTTTAVAKPVAAKAHKCLVMTGSGDPAFTRNFNPYAGGGLPTNSIAQGAFYEPLIVVPAGGRKTLPWLARSWKWSNGNKTLTLNIARNARWSDGTRLTTADVVYSLTAGRQDKTMDRIGLVGAGNEIASIKAKGAHSVVISLKNKDSQFISCHPQPGVRRSEAHLDQGRRPGDLHEPDACRLGPLQRRCALHDAGLRPQQEQALLAARIAEDRMPRVRTSVVE